MQVERLKTATFDKLYLFCTVIKQ